MHTKNLSKKQNWFRINNVSNVNEVQNLGERERERASNLRTAIATLKHRERIIWPNTFGSQTK